MKFSWNYNLILPFNFPEDKLILLPGHWTKMLLIDRTNIWIIIKLKLKQSIDLSGPQKSSWYPTNGHQLETLVKEQSRVQF